MCRKILLIAVAFIVFTQFCNAQEIVPKPLIAVPHSKRDSVHEVFKVDLSCAHNSTTFKDSWTRWRVNGGCEGEPIGTVRFDNIADSHINATLQAIGGPGNLVAGSGEPLANTSFTYNKARERFGPRYLHSDEMVPVVNTYGLDIELTLSGPGLEPGEYILKTYHNRQGRRTNSSDSSLAAIVATGPGVQQHTKVTNVPIQNTDSDEKLAPAEIRFTTDGSGPVTIMFFAEGKTNAVLNAFCLYSVNAPKNAYDPFPPDGAVDVMPDVKLSWNPGTKAPAYNVYIRRELRDVMKVKSGEINFAGRVTENSIKPDELLMGHKYYWRVDGMLEADPKAGRRTWKTGSGGMFTGYDPNTVNRGRTWSFTVIDGKATKPYPLDTAINVPLKPTLKWQPGPLAETHKVYFGTKWEDVADFAKPVYEGKASEFKPGKLKKVTTYYWRVDQIHGDKTVTGDVWQFMTEGTLAIQVDLAVPKWGSSEPIPETAKPGWTIWSSPAWADIYSHDKQMITDVAGTTIDVQIALGSEGMGALKAKGLRMSARGGGGKPSGKITGDPLCNTWFESADWASYGSRAGTWGNVLLLISDLPAGQYELYSWHNHFYHCDRFEDNCVGVVKFRGGFYQSAPEQGPMPAVRAVSLPPKALPKYDKWAFAPGTGKGVESIQNAYNVSATHVDDDWKLSPSLIKFRTDGSPVLVIYEAPRDYWDYREYPGGRAILNAFRLIKR